MNFPKGYVTKAYWQKRPHPEKLSDKVNLPGEKTLYIDDSTKKVTNAKECLPITLSQAERIDLNTSKADCRKDEYKETSDQVLMNRNTDYIQQIGPEQDNISSEGWKTSKGT